VADELRTYRRWLRTELRPFRVRIGESDLWISAERPLRALAERALVSARSDLEAYLKRDPGFGAALRPYELAQEAPAIVREMAEAGRLCGVGPMAAVAGAVAESVGRALLTEAGEVIVENGGDIFLYSKRPRTAAIYAGSSPLSGRLGLRLSLTEQALGLCTSSGTVGPSLSFGKADAATVLATSAALADAAASALGNRIQSGEDIPAGLEYVQLIPGVLGAAVVIGEHLGAWGELELVKVGPERQRRLGAADGPG
jgi:ApbE superfamily uncharacterized protein (UPF0280 family)